MARSTYIYMACDYYGDVIVIGTVKHEVLTYVKKNYPACTTIRRYRDGYGDEYTLLDFDKFDCPEVWYSDKLGGDGFREVLKCKVIGPDKSWRDHTLIRCPEGRVLHACNRSIFNTQEEAVNKRRK